MSSPDFKQESNMSLMHIVSKCSCPDTTPRQGHHVSTANVQVSNDTKETQCNAIST